ncbi:Maf family protein [Butyrivibrio sp. MC2013]|uniref:Maf family protein n=1 Tax=Butyrivibrio sp. MC2013 TaxID=1280686 RepID=UPI00040B67F0|nr:Maf family protein [Butyrivibrio sp. MC2013]
MTDLILASASPRRRELMKQAGLECRIIPAVGEEKAEADDPALLVEELSFQKAREVFEKVTGRQMIAPTRLPAYNGEAGDNITDGFSYFGSGPVVIGADTVVSYNHKVMGKPVDKDNAREMIDSIQGGEHEVFTGVTFIWPDEGCDKYVTFHELTRVMVYPMSSSMIEDYISGEEPYDKAGAYGIQGSFAINIKGINGDYNNVVGLPVSRLYRSLDIYGLI